MSIVHLVSVSGGKDSTATLLYALATQPRESVRAVFADTGNEHEATIEYVAYLADATGVPIRTLKPDFTEWWWRRRDYIRDVYPTKLVAEGYTDVDGMIARMLEVFDEGPSGIPFLDLAMIKGRFPSKAAQFCTQELKTNPLAELALDIIDREGVHVWSWQGIRSEESPHRARTPEFEEIGGGLWAYRPIKRWKIGDVFDAHREFGIKPNPLYKLGMSRVGCMPCINANKNEIREMARRFPEHMDRIEAWEIAVGQACRREFSTFFAKGPGDSPGDIGPRAVYETANIREVIRWSQTTRGGRQFDLLAASEELPACSSAYGLCE